MEKGYNSDVTVQGIHYHVQTEDWGKENPFLVSRIFCNGAVVRSVKTPYSSALRAQVRLSSLGHVSTSQALRLAMIDQHNRILDQLLTGDLPGI